MVTGLEDGSVNRYKEVKSDAKMGLCCNPSCTLPDGRLNAASYCIVRNALRTVTVPVNVRRLHGHCTRGTPLLQVRLLRTGNLAPVLSALINPGLHHVFEMGAT